MLREINRLLVDTLGPQGPVLATLALGLALVVLALPALLNRKAEPFDKLKAQRKNLAARTPNPDALRSTARAQKLERFKQFLEPTSAEELSASRLTMVRAGYRSKDAVRMFHLAQLVLGVGLMAIGTIYALSAQQSGEVSTQQVVLYAILPGAIGYYIPKYWITRRVQERQAQIIAGFPDALDMMLVCVEAGQSLDQSILRVARESQTGYPALAEEFDIVANETKAGKERIQVLKDMAERVGVPDVNAFVTTLVQSATFGTSISDALRVYSNEMRDKRIMRAEEKANTIPTKLTLGTMLFTLPPLMVILIGPSIYEIATRLGGG